MHKLKVFLLGMKEFRQSVTTHPGNDFIEVYDSGRDLAHRITFRRWDV